MTTASGDRTRGPRPALPLRDSVGISPNFADAMTALLLPGNATLPSIAPMVNEMSTPSHGEAASSTAREQPPADDPRPEDLVTPESLVLVHTGHGKGKSSAAFGVMLRGVARGWRVVVVQFLKSGEWRVGEEELGRRLGVEWHALGDGFTWDSADIERDRRTAAAAWGRAAALVGGGGHDLVILDELTYLINWGWVDAAGVVAALRDRPRHVSVVVTGRDAPHVILDVADTVTEMVNVKHAYQRGLRAMRGIDY